MPEIGLASWLAQKLPYGQMSRVSRRRLGGQLDYSTLQSWRILVLGIIVGCFTGNGTLSKMSE